MNYDKTCVVCGKKFIAKRCNKVCCSDDCAKIHRNYLQSEHKKSHQKVKDAKKHRHLTFTEKMRAADAAKLTYGKYVGMMYLKEREEYEKHRKAVLQVQ